MTKAHNLGNIAKAKGLTLEESEALHELVKVYSKHRRRNARLTRYYDGKVRANDVNIGIAVPEELENLEVACTWPAKVVDSLHARSQFDAFWHSDGAVKAVFDEICEENDMQLRYSKAVVPELKHGFVLWTLAMGDDDRARIRAHTAQSSAARWDGAHDRVLDGFVIVDSAKFNFDRSYKPSLVNFYTADKIVVLRRVNATDWVAEPHPHKMGRPLMEAMVYNPTDEKPFGKSRINKAVMHLTDGYLRSMLRMEVGAELFTSPQKVLLGADDTMIEELSGSFQAYITHLFTISPSAETGDTPEMIQLAASSMTPHIEVMRCLAANLSGSSNVPISELGVIQDNPASAEAIYAAKEALVTEADGLNRDNGKALKNLMLMAYAMNEDCSWSEIPPAYRKITPHFANPATPSIVSQADAMTKIASVDPDFAGTTAFYNQIGFDDALIQQIVSEKAVASSRGFLSKLIEGVENGGTE